MGHHPPHHTDLIAWSFVDFCPNFMTSIKLDSGVPCILKRASTCHSHFHYCFNVFILTLFFRLILFFFFCLYFLFLNTIFVGFRTRPLQPCQLPHQTLTKKSKQSSYTLQVVREKLPGCFSLDKSSSTQPRERKNSHFCS